MSLEVKGRIIAILPLATGSSTKGEWKSQTAVLETTDQYPKKIAFDMFGDKIQVLKIGDEVELSANVESREYNGRWYTSVRVWKMNVNGVIAPTAPVVGSDDGSDLPF